MDVLTAVCRRLLGADSDDAARFAADARRASGESAQLVAALEACRIERDPASQAQAPAPAELREPAAGTPDLRSAVAGELAAAAAAVPERQQQALALRDVAGLSHAQIADVLAVEPVAVTTLLTRARLAFRAALRAEATPEDACPERDRALQAITLRLDGEAVSDADEDWLIEHLGLCPGCRRAHASLLESAACYRGWPAPDAAPARPGPGDVAAPAAP